MDHYLHENEYEIEETNERRRYAFPAIFQEMILSAPEDNEQIRRPDIYNLTITIGEKDRLRILEFAKAVKKEIYLVMLVERNGNHFHLHNLLYFKQKSTSASTDCVTQDIDRYIRELLNSGRPFEEAQKELLAMRCWVHSHGVGGRCWWSPEDQKNCERQNNGDYLISVVVALGYDDTLFYNCRLDIFEPKKEEIRQALQNLGIYRPGRLTISSLPIDVVDDREENFDPGKIKQEAQKMAKQKVEFLKEDEDEAYERRIKIASKIRKTRNGALAAETSCKTGCDNRHRRGWLNNGLRSFLSWLHGYNCL